MCLRVQMGPLHTLIINASRNSFENGITLVFYVSLVSYVSI